MNNEKTGWFSPSQGPCDPQPPRLDHPYRAVLLGPPGVGKGTQAKLLCQQLRACHLSTGDLFRAASCDGATSPAMQQALDAMQRGELVSDDLVIEMVRERAQCLRCHGGFLLDGFPRTVHQAEALEQIVGDLSVSLDAVISYEMAIDEVVARLSGRRTCGQCQAVYHVVSRPPQTPDVCDDCGGQLIQRDDDQPEAVRVRMETYAQQTQPLIDFYQQQNKLLQVEATGTPQEVFDRTLARIVKRDRVAAGT